MKFTAIIIIFFALGSVVCAQSFKISSSDLGVREYLPGDIVHIVIEAPLDTSQVKAVMPDGDEITLNYDGRSNLWHGYWEVPSSFKKGIYQANLRATDVEGGHFEGISTAFYIGEPVLALMMRITATSEAPAGRLSEKERIARQRAVESARLAKEETRKKAMTEKMIEETAGAQTEAEVAPPARPEVKTVIKRAIIKRKIIKVAVRPKPRRMARRTAAKEDFNVTKARLVVAARSYMAQFEYKKAMSELKALLKIEPDNKEVRVILKRLEAVIRAKENRQ